MTKPRAVNRKLQALSLKDRIEDAVAPPAQVAKTLQSAGNAQLRIDSLEKQGHCHFGSGGIAVFVIFGLLRSILLNAVNGLERKKKREQQRALEEKIQKELANIKKIRGALDLIELSKRRFGSANRMIMLEEEQRKLFSWLYDSDSDKEKEAEKEREKSKKKLRQYFPGMSFDFTTEKPQFILDLIKENKNNEELVRNRLLNAMRSQDEIWFSQLVMACFMINTFVYAVFAAKSGYVFLLYCAALCGTTSAVGLIPGAFVLAGVMFFGSMFTSQNAIMGSISKDCRSFCDFLRSEKKFERIHAVYVFVAICAIATAPLLYVSLLPLFVKLLVLMHMASLAVMPFAMTMIILFVAVTVLYAVRLAWSQVKTMNEKFSKLLGPESEVYKQYKKEGRIGLYWFWIAVGAVIISAVIATGVIGDMFGISKMLPPHWSVFVAAGIMSGVCNILLNWDFVHRMPEYAHKLGQWISGLFCKKAEIKKPDDLVVKALPGEGETSPMLKKEESCLSDKPTTSDSGRSRSPSPTPSVTDGPIIFATKLAAKDQETTPLLEAAPHAKTA